MKTERAGRTEFRRARFSIPLMTGVVLATVLSGCSSTTGAGTSDNVSHGTASDLITASSVDQTQLAATAKRALLADVPVSDLPPVVADAFAVASKPLTDAQTALLKKCLTQRSCDTGHGTLTVAINADFTNNPCGASVGLRPRLRRSPILKSRKSSSPAASSGDIAEVLANLRSLIARRSTSSSKTRFSVPRSSRQQSRPKLPASPL